jgi:hypothetical protein
MARLLQARMLLIIELAHDQMMNYGSIRSVRVFKFFKYTLEYMAWCNEVCVVFGYIWMLI